MKYKESKGALAMPGSRAATLQGGGPDLMLSCTVKAMRAALAAAGKVTGRSASPILETVMFRGGTVTALSPGLDFSLSVEIAGCSASGTGAAIDLRDLKRVLAKRKAGEAVNIMARRDRALVTIASQRFTLPCFGPGEWPTMAGPDESVVTRIPGDALGEALADVIGAVSVEETRYYLNGVLFTRRPTGALTLVATDGHRLCRHETAVRFPDERDAILPRQAAAALAHMLKGADPAPVAIASGETLYGFAGRGWMLTSRLIDGTYPDWQRVIPRAGRAVLVDTATLAAAATACDSPIVLEFAAGRVREAGAARRFEAPMPFQGDAGIAQIAFNPRYLGHILERCNGTVALGLVDPGAPALIADPARRAFLAALMPMRA